MSLNINAILINSVSTFEKNAKAVEELMAFDQLILDICIINLEKVEARLTDAKIDNPRLRIGNTIQAMKNIRNNASLKAKYEEMQNQCLVLLVSYFSLSLRDLFKGCIAYALSTGSLNRLARQEVKIFLEDLRVGDDDFSETVANIFIAQKDISFQDMQSMARALDEYLGYKPEKEENVNNIILSQACRHAIVHSGSVMDSKMLRQVSNAKPRTVKPDTANGQRIQFQPDEIRAISASMLAYLNATSAGIKRAWKV